MKTPDPMDPDSKPPSSRSFTPDEAPTVRHRASTDALAHLYEIQHEVERSIQAIEANPSDSIRMMVLDSLSRIKNKIKQFEDYLGVY